jgi:hypothetical protein
VEVKVNPLIEYLGRVYAEIALPTCCLINKNIVTGACQYVLFQTSEAFCDIAGETGINSIDLISKNLSRIRRAPAAVAGENVFRRIECNLLPEVWPCGRLWIPWPNLSDSRQILAIDSGVGSNPTAIEDIHSRMNKAIDR